MRRVLFRGGTLHMTLAAAGEELFASTQTWTKRCRARMVTQIIAGTMRDKGMDVIVRAVEIAAGERVGDNLGEVLLCGANKRSTGPSNVIQIRFGGSV